MMSQRDLLILIGPEIELEPSLHQEERCDEVKHIVNTWSSTKYTIALSSCEADLYALTKTARQWMGIAAMATHSARELQIIVRSDSTAAMGIVHRQSFGRTRRVQVQHVWLQEQLKDKAISLSLVDTKMNIVDLLTTL